MTYRTYETSLTQGQPVELYRFSTEHNTYDYTGSEEFNHWISAPISRSGSPHSLDPSTATLTLTVPRDLEVIQQYLVSPPPAPVRLIVYNIHRGDPDNEFEMRWVGRISNVKWSGAHAEVYCESLLVSLKRMGLRRLHSRTCTYAVYDGTTCAKGLAATTEDSSNMLKFRMGALYTCLWVNDTQAGFSVYPGGDAGKIFTQNYYTGGMLEWTGTDGERHYLGIDWHDHVSSYFNLSYADPHLIPGALILAVPNCGKVSTECIRFGNYPNFGGQPFRKRDNPFNLVSII